MNPNEDRGELGGFPNRENDKHTKSVFSKTESKDAVPQDADQNTVEAKSFEESENTNPAPEKIKGEGDE